MNIAPCLRRSAARICVCLAGGALATAVVAKDIDLAPEEQVKLHKLTAFLKKADQFLPTVNRIDGASLPMTFPFDLVLDHVVVDVAVGDGEALPYMFGIGGPARPRQGRHRTPVQGETQQPFALPTG